MSDSKPSGLVADIGGTNARIALVYDGRYGAIHKYAVAQFPTPADAIKAFLAKAKLSDPPQKAVLAVAGPVEAGRAHLTNVGWYFDTAELAQELGISQVRLVNDFAAVATSLPLFTGADLYPVGGGAAVTGWPSVVLGPGTGLGVAAFVPTNGGTVLATEGGHASLSAGDRREAEILAFLRDRFQHVSAERVLSGPGLGALYEALQFIDGWEPAPPLGADEITARALGGQCAASIATLKTFCAMLGGFAGNVALTIGARGGIYIVGGILPRFPEFLAKSEFRERFEAKGRFRDWLANVPTFVVIHADPAFPGLVALLEETA